MYFGDKLLDMIVKIQTVVFSLNSLNMQNVHLSVNIAMKFVKLVVEDRLFVISAFFSFCKGV